MDFEYTNKAKQSFLVKWHKKIHWLLVYKESDFPALDDYFGYILFQIRGLQKMYPDDYRILELHSLIEGARVEANKDDYRHSIYRKAIFDAHGLISELEKELVDE